NTLSNVLRGREGTSPAPHSSGTVVENRFTAGTYDEIKQTVTSCNDALTSHLAESATTSQKGHVQLSSSTSSTSTSLAATASAVKTVNDALTSHLADDMHIPRGLIAMWSGSIEMIPTGWALCDGKNGTPDLRDRFIVGAGNEYTVGDIGGSNKVTLTLSQLPSHSHSSGTLSTNSAGSHSHDSGTLSTSTTGSHTHTIGFGKDNLSRSTGSNSAPFGSGSTTTSSSGSHSHSISGSTSSAGSHSHSVTGATSSVGGGEAHENRPPYYALAFIMKL
ncbi:MAG: hypothetical protein GX854_00185, partial [Clostridiales bacterium]|nr:hypothetical protein [Clostridiales bacterium]